MNIVSIVMCTYNGEKNILEQLDSIRNQTYPADEVLIYDDCSTDNTQSKITEYMKQNKLNNWKLIMNDHNKGWKLNFRDALREAKGDLIFLCDQDDIWETEKIEKMVSIMNTNKTVELLISNYEPFYENEATARISRHLINNNQDKSTEKIMFTKKFWHIGAPGCTYCLRKEILNDFFKFSNIAVPHDYALWLIAMYHGSIYRYNSVTMHFRRSGENATGSKKTERYTKKNRIKEIDDFIDMLTYLEEFCKDDNSNSRKIKIIHKAKSFNIHRAEFIKGKKSEILHLVVNCGYYLSLKSLLGDIAVSLSCIR